MELNSDNVLIGLFAFIGTTLITVMTALWRKVNGVESRGMLLKQCQDNFDRQRTEDLALRKEQRSEVMDSINQHHKAVMARMDRLEKVVKNGHG